MNNRKPIKKLFKKFLLDECSKEEINQLPNYFKKAKPSANFPTVEKILKFLNEPPVLKKDRADEIFNYIISLAH